MQPAGGYAMWTRMLLVAIVTLVAAPALADCSQDSLWVGIPDLSYSTVTVGYSGPATLLVVPDGSGAPFTEARGPGGAVVDATITLTLIAECGTVPHYPREDMWLEALGTTLAACVGGTLADTDTDANGQTRWTLPLRAGGREPVGCHVIVSGWPITGASPPNLRLVSPDLNGDGVVALNDIPLFAQAYAGAYAFRADLHTDGAINLSDIPLLARAMGAHCD